MKHKMKSTVAPALLLVLAFALSISVACGMVESGGGAEQPVSDGPTVKAAGELRDRGRPGKTTGFQKRGRFFHEG